MNKIVESLLNDFLANQTPEPGWANDVAFEHFAAFLTIGSWLDSTLDTTLCVVGEDAQPAVDAAAVTVNGVLVVDTDDVDTYDGINGYLDVDFFLVQAKTSASFDASALGALGDFAERIFFRHTSQCQQKGKNLPSSRRPQCCNSARCSGMRASRSRSSRSSAATIPGWNISRCTARRGRACSSATFSSASGG